MDAEMKTETRTARKKGLVMVNTGDGKGKTTAALGVLMRSWGQGLRVCMLQFIKGEKNAPGEMKAAQKMGIEWYQTGDGFVWRSNDQDESKAHALHGWQMAQEKISSGNYDLVVLDEFTYPLHFGWLDTAEVLAWLREHKPAPLHLLITGRYAPAELIEYADLVTNMTLVKHPWEQGIPGQKGIEF
jgi:cob(I)alamin adenosyltransferase